MINLGTAGTQSGDVIRDAFGKLASLVYYYGLAWDESANTYQRTGATEGQPVGQTLTGGWLPVQESLRRCILSDAGEVQYYLDPNDSTKRADTGNAANLDGSDGQVVVEIPKFYVRYSYTGSTHQWDISFIPLPGFTLHPAFLKNGKIVNYRYIGAYEAVLYDDSVGTYIDGDASGSQYAAGDTLGSISGFKPISNESRATFRTAAAAVGTGWRQQDYWLMHAIQLLYLIEYANFDSQAMIGNGNTAYDAWDFANNIGKTGFSNADGNDTNASDSAFNSLTTTDPNDGSTNKEYMSYRGIENFYGSVWQFLDGINIKNVESTSKSEAWISNMDTDFADNMSTNYQKLTENLPLTTGYQQTLIQSGFSLGPKTVGSNYIDDYFWTYYDNLTAGFGTDWRVARLGASAISGSQAGAFTLAVHSDSALASSRVGGRLCF